jgi:UDP-glucose:(heptosyl)LPS alpha-1,3-glucosyltransferase
MVFAGSTDEPERYYGAADLLVHPTFYDACSRTVLEAMASGLPVITTTSNGASGILTNGEEGFVIEDPRNIENFSERIALFWDEDKRKGASFRSRRCIEHYIFDKDNKTLKEVFHRCIQMSGEESIDHH